MTNVSEFRTPTTEDRTEELRYLSRHFEIQDTAATTTHAIRFGALQPSGMEPEIVPTFVVDLVEELRAIKVDAELWLRLPNTWKFQIVESFLEQHLLTAFSGETVVQTFRAFLDRNRNGSLLEQAVHRHCQLSGLQPDERRRLVAMLADLVNWPHLEVPALQRAVEEWATGRVQIEAFPAAEAMRTAGRLLAQSDAPTPTGIGLCFEGGIGIAWSDRAYAADVMILNDGDVTFSFRKRGDPPVFLKINPAIESEVAEAVRRVRSLGIPKP